MDELIKVMGLDKGSERLTWLLCGGQNWLYVEFDSKGKVLACNQMLNGKTVVGLKISQVVDLPGDIPLPLSRLEEGDGPFPLIVRWQPTGELYESTAMSFGARRVLLGHRFLLSDEPFLGTSLMMETFDLRKRVAEREQEVRRLKGQISRLMGSDPLTGLANENRFLHVLETEIKVAMRHSTPLSLIGCDMDYFRTINETFGREMGDAVLVRLSDVLRRFLRREDLAARYRSVTFFVLLPRTTKEQAFTLAERIRMYLPTVNLESEGGENPVNNLSASFSVSEYRPGESLSEYLYRTEAALADAKSQGRNRTISAD